MRIASLFCLLLLPLPLVAQYPEPGTYKGEARFVGTENKVALVLEVESSADSAIVRLRQDGQQQAIPLNAKRLTASGFTIGFGGLTCPFVTVENRWEAICADPLDTPQFLLVFPKQPESAPPGD